MGYTQAVSAVVQDEIHAGVLTGTQNKIAADPTIDSEGAMLVAVVLGADKTTVSVATVNQGFHPLYMSLGNIHNNLRRSHRDRVIPLAFFPIPASKNNPICVIYIA